MYVQKLLAFKRNRVYACKKSVTTVLAKLDTESRRSAHLRAARVFEKGNMG
jgi:hypothetical protein